MCPSWKIWLRQWEGLSHILREIKNDWNILKPPPSLLSHVTASVASSLYWRESFGCWMMLRISFGCWIIMDWWLQDIVPQDQTQLPSAGTCNKRSAKSLELSEVPVTFANKYLVDMTRDQGENLTLKRWDVRCTPPKKLIWNAKTFALCYISIIISTHMYSLTYLLTCPKKSSGMYIYIYTVRIFIPTCDIHPMLFPCYSSLVSSIWSPWSLPPSWRTWHPQVSRPQRCLATDSAFRRANRA